MANKKVSVKAEVVFEVEYDPESKLFKQTLSEYRETANSDAEEDDLIINVVHQCILRQGTSSMFESIGYVRDNGKITGDPDSGISITNDDPLYDYEII